jgi:signal transduction histidine kinase
MMTNMARLYLKQFVEWAIASQEKYKSDLFFRTTIQIVTLQAMLVVVCLSAFVFSLYNPEDKWYAFGGVLLLSVLCGNLLARFTLGPARDTLRYQKLFISNVAHELRTPLAVIKTSTEVGLIDDTLSLDTKQTFNDILAELDRVSEILNNLLSLNALTRPERMQFTTVSLGPLVESVIKRHAVLANERRIKVTFKKDSYTSVYGNATALEQIIANLVKNAISYTPKDSQGEVLVEVTPKGDMMMLAVSDNGIGIAQEDLFHIFEPFYRADMSRNRKIKKSGTGLGLTIVNELVRVHRGKIQVQSALRKGTCVSIFLPFGSAAVSHAPAAEDTENSEISLDFSKSKSAGSQFASANR